jgi:hypothetical protein
VGVYVDDLIITGSNVQVLSSFKREMCKSFKMSDLGALSYYLGIEVQQIRDGITICQGAYAKKILEAAGLEESNPSRSPRDGNGSGSGQVEQLPIRQQKGYG